MDHSGHCLGGIFFFFFFSNWLVIEVVGNYVGSTCRSGGVLVWMA